MARTISFVKGKGSINHNNRDFIASNVDASRSSLNITYVKKPIEEAYEEIFGEALKEYNDKQKRNDRKIKDYLSHVKQSKNNEKIFYENVVQIGRMNDTGILDKDGNITDEALLAKEVLDEYAKTFQERNPNLILFNAVLHMDEATPHLHMDYIPVAHGYKTGLKTRNSLSKGLQEMGIEPAKGKNDNETMHWQQREREHITALCKARGMDIEVLGVERDDYSIPEYKTAMREKEAAEAEIEILRSEKEEAASLLESSLDRIGSNLVQIEDQKETLEEIEEQIREAERKRAAKKAEIRDITNAMKPTDKELKEIEKKVTPVSSLFGGEPMVKMPKRIYDKIITRYQLADTLERLYGQYETKASIQQRTIEKLTKEISDLKAKIGQLTKFIETKGLMEAFKEFLKPKPILETLKEKKKIVAERAAQPKKQVKRGHVR